jgi:hypothetical protein
MFCWSKEILFFDEKRNALAGPVPWDKYLSALFIKEKEVFMCIYVSKTMVRY